MSGLLIGPLCAHARSEAACSDCAKEAALREALIVSREVTAKLYEAVKYTLDRIQRDPDLGYQAGELTETFERLTAAEAAVLDVAEKAVKERRRAQLWGAREPRVVELERRIEELEEDLAEWRESA